MYGFRLYGWGRELSCRPILPPVLKVFPVLTPCTGVCSLDLQGFCEGCQRTGTEIAGWLQMSDQERLRMMEEVLPAREAGQG